MRRPVGLPNSMVKHTAMNMRRLALESKRMVDFVSLTVLLVFVLLFEVSTSSSKYDRENWVNPDDMINYDRSSKTMRSPKANDHRESQVNPGSSDDCNRDELEKLLEKLTICENIVLEQPPSPIPQPESDNQEDVKKTFSGGTAKIEYQYMRRFINVLLHASGLVDASLEEGETRQSLISIDVTAEHLATLQQFGTAGSTVSLSEIDDVLSHILHSSNTGFYVPLGWLERLTHMFSSRDVMYKLVPCGITVVALVMLILRRKAVEIVITFLILILALSYQWTYDYMIKMAEIRQYVALKQLDSIPLSCRAPETLYEYLGSWLRSDTGECHKYYKAHMMNPALEVTPTVVLSEMLAAMLLHPAGKLGEGIAKFSGGILGGLPMFSNWIVLILSLVFVAVVSAVVLVILFGGQLRLPFFLSGLEVTGQAPRPLTVARESVEEIAAPVPTVTNANPFVSAISSSSEGLVLMNLPILERLMSAREDRPVQREFVERLVAVENTAMGTSVCLQCSGSEDTEGEKDVVQRMKDGLLEREDSGKNVAKESRRKPNVVLCVGSQSGGGDCVSTDTFILEENSSFSTFAHLGSGDNVSVPCLLEKKMDDDSFLGVKSTEGNLERRSNVSSKENKESIVIDQLNKSEFIDELRKILEEQDSIEESSSTAVDRKRDVSIEGTELTSAGRPDLADTLERILEECTADTMAKTVAGSSESNPELIRKVSTDSSDASGDFVKL